MLTLTHTLATIATTLVLLAPSVSAREWAGGVDMQEACRWQYRSDNAKAILTKQVAATANDWVCINTGIAWNSIDVDAYCKRRYAKENRKVYADPQGGWAYDWGCYYE